ncbi:MAG TPA: hypothetical protein VL961_02160 [Acidimicrobiales bacterium]|nr:hypothetical protein [Acidimicrobiales bacterium]
MPTQHQRADRFRYVGYSLEPARGRVSCHYETAGHAFTEEFDFGPGGHWDDPTLGAAVRILFLMAGVSYYKTTAARVVDLGETVSTAADRAFLAEYFVHGLGEFAFRNGLDLRDLRVIGPDAGGSPPVDYVGSTTSPLIPFGGGIDSIVTATALADRRPSLFVMHPQGHRFDAIEGAVTVSGLPVARAGRTLSPLVRRSSELGFFNGHVPVTAIVTAAALVAAVLGGYESVVMSNEHSASQPTVVDRGHPINHQWSKGVDFERGFGELVRRSLGTGVPVFSYLRPRSELWVAQKFAELDRFHPVFQSCNRAFHQDPAQRLDHWCGTCDKCCFIDLILSPFMDRTALEAIFGGSEPLADVGLLDRFRTLLDVGAAPKPFECVGDTAECRGAVLLAAERPDRHDSDVLRALRAEVLARPDPRPPSATTLLAPMGPHYIPETYAPPDLLVRAG